MKRSTTLAMMLAAVLSLSPGTVLAPLARCIRCGALGHPNGSGGWRCTPCDRSWWPDAPEDSQ